MATALSGALPTKIVFIIERQIIYIFHRDVISTAITAMFESTRTVYSTYRPFKALLGTSASLMQDKPGMGHRHGLLSMAMHH